MKPVAATAAILSLFALSACSANAPEVRPFCDVATDLAAPGGDAMDAFGEAASTATSATGAGDDGAAAALGTAAVAAVGEVSFYVSLLDEARAAADDADVSDSLVIMADTLSSLSAAIDGAFGEVDSADDVGPAVEQYIVDLQLIDVGATFEDANDLVEDYVEDTCGFSLAQADAASSAKGDVATLGKEIATYFVDGLLPDEPMVAVVDGQYVVVGEIVGNVSPGVVLENQFAFSSSNWCVEVTSAEGETFSYSASHGLSGESCSAVAAG